MINVLAGVLNQSIFSLLSATVFIFINWSGPTCPENELFPQEPHPNVNDGDNLKLYISPIPPWADGVLTNILQAFILLSNSFNFSWLFTTSMYIPAVCPIPPPCTNSSALSTASSKSSALYIDNNGNNFSCASGSDISVEVASPIINFVSAGTSNPASWAISIAGLPTNLAFIEPFAPRTIFFNFTNSSPSAI